MRMARRSPGSMIGYTRVVVASLILGFIWWTRRFGFSINRLLHHGKRIDQLDGICEDYATARLDLASGAAINLSCSWHLHAGRDAVIEASFYGTKGGAAMRNVNGSFYDFIAKRFNSTSRQVLAAPPDELFGRAAVEWARRLARDP